MVISENKEYPDFRRNSEFLINNNFLGKLGITPNSPNSFETPFSTLNKCEISQIDVNFCYPNLSAVAFWIGRRDYRHIIVNENVVGKFLRCIRVTST